MPSSSDTRHMWFRWSNHASRWMHLLQRASARCLAGQRRLLLSIERVSFLQLLEDANFNLARVAIFRYSSYNLNCDPLVRLRVDGFDDLAKCALTQQSNGTILGCMD